ncbi:MAG: hypothetical protein HY880_06225 [Deltaproteobacteria bacterium]|nr:hypothetical protein [Deltaproteobacteria bacterium]
MRIRAPFAITLLIMLLMSPAPVFSQGLGDMRLESKLESMKRAGVGPVVFPHTRHEKTIKCNECHPRIFIDKRGANDINMKKNMNSQACGSINCHNSPKTFPLFECAKCHTNVKTVK